MKSPSETSSYNKIFNFYIKSEQDLRTAIEKIQYHAETIYELSLINERIISPIQEALKQQLILAISKCVNLKTVKIEAFKSYFSDTIVDLVQSLALLKSLTSLHFVETYIGELGCEVLTTEFANLPLSKLVLIDAALMPHASYEDLSTFIKVNKHLTFLDISYNPIWANRCYMLLQALEARRFPKLKLVFDIMPSWESNQQLYIDRLSQTTIDPSEMFLLAAKSELKEYQNNDDLGQSFTNHQFDLDLHAHKLLIDYVKTNYQLPIEKSFTLFYDQTENKGDILTADEEEPLIDTNRLSGNYGSFKL